MQQILQSTHPFNGEIGGTEQLGDGVSQVERIRNTAFGDLIPWFALALACTVGIGMTLFWLGRLVP